MQRAVWAGTDRILEGHHMVPAAAGEAEPGPRQAAEQGQGQEQHPCAGLPSGASFLATSVTACLAAWQPA